MSDVDKFIIIEGNVVDGFKHIGPFDDAESAQSWAEQYCDDSWSVISLYIPWYQGRPVIPVKR